MLICKTMKQYAKLHVQADIHQTTPYAYKLIQFIVSNEWQRKQTMKVKCEFGI